MFESSVTAGIFLEGWKKANIIPVHKKESKNCLKKYRPIIFLQAYFYSAKIFERLIFTAIFNFFVQNQLFTDCQSSFILGDSCVSQLLYITLEIHKSVWHEGRTFKLKTYGAEGKLIMLLENYLKNKKQRVVLNGLSSSWKKILAGVPRKSVLGPLLFLTYINDLPHDISSICKMFADDTWLFSKVKKPALSDLNYYLETRNQSAH